MKQDQWTSLLSVDEARSEILKSFMPVDTTTVQLHQALHRVLAEEIVAPFDLPRFTNSSVDGFAFRLDKKPHAGNQKMRLPVIGDIPAGSTDRIRILPGQAARILTGAALPAGADRVVPVEDTDFPYRDPSTQAPDYVTLIRIPEKGANIRPRGQDVAKGTRIFLPKRQLNPGDIGLLAMIGKLHVLVHRQPRIAIFSSGDELTALGRRLPKGKIYDANSHMLQALVDESTCQPFNLGIARDQPENIRAFFERAVKKKADLILTTAGVSVGVFDYVRKFLEEEGQLKIWRVNMRPGKPLTFGYYRSTPVISLPGNPVSAFVGFQVFVRPVLRKLMGMESDHRPTLRARLDAPIQSDGRETYLRGVVRKQADGYSASLCGHQGSGNLFSLVQANALLILPSGVQSLPAGAEVDAWILTDLIE